MADHKDELLVGSFRDFEIGPVTFEPETWVYPVDDDLHFYIRDFSGNIPSFENDASAHSN